MKTIKRTMLAVLVGAVTLLTSCNEDSPEKKRLGIQLADSFYSLDGANFYFYRESSGYYLEDGGVAKSDGAASHKFRQYVISDGTFNGEWLSGDTYYFYFELAVPITNEFMPGDFPAHAFWSVPANSNISYFEFENETEYVYTYDEAGHDPIVVKGSFEDGERMTITFDSQAWDWINNAAISMNLYFKGDINDVRPTEVAVRLDNNRERRLNRH